MARTNQERYSGALKHIKKLNAALETEVDQQIAIKALAGGEISLKGKGYWSSGSNEQHWAVRGLLLCHIAFFRPPFGSKLMATKEALDELKEHCPGKSLSYVNDRIKEFLVKPGATRDDLVNATNTICQTTGTVDYFKRSRTDINVGPSPICYDGVVNWLFTSGFVSKKYLAKEASDMHATRSNQYIGQGVTVPRNQWNQIPRGCIWNIQRKGDPSTCHWGVSLGNGKAVACNNTAGSPSYGLVTFDQGMAGMKYGTFDFEELCLVLNSDLKYGHMGGATPPDSEDANITVRQIDPLMAGCYR